MNSFSITIHGGAGTILRSSITPEEEAAYRGALALALDRGYEVLKSGGRALDAVRVAVMALEDDILFNAGRGSVFANDGSQEMDASIMDGSNLMAGAVSAVRNVRNPIELAYEVMVSSPHVLLSGPGAIEFAKSRGLKMEPDEYFYSQYRHEQWKMMRGTEEVALDHDVVVKDNKFGTVGAAACDQSGNLAAATSTGGMTNKQWGRVGDSSMIGGGTYANNKTCAISCTGHGEMFIRAVAAYDVSCLMEYKGFTLAEAMKIVVHEKLMRINGEGGMIGVDSMGNAEMIFNSEGMYRGRMDSSGLREIAIYG